ncbi:tRNA preQ1(34) S-adenosylmethionine ribosyltransferase-isomerase QueA [Candidatus Dojkabacteria bacterium]|jgi:S-adenosylmethionine:tRNA ribosyltransferase-isomerase|nr:tRNA preQ1(34) S-adenosylmethionine ribosyltransferase-isomerase QueA [Candidatus Dojkabacteria bacterium]
MKLSLFNYNLPKEKIAQFPPKVRGTTKLLILDRKDKSISHKRYSDIPSYIKKGDVLVINNTKVEKVRVFLVNKRNDKRIECIFLNKLFLGDINGFEFGETILGRSQNFKIGDVLISDERAEVEVVKKVGDSVYLVRSKEGAIDKVINKHGHVPLPPYIKREDNEQDYGCYNTVFAKNTGSAAAPTAGLNITDELLLEMKKKGVEIVEVKLDVGWGTFAPIREDEIEKHKIHSETIEITKESADKINDCIKKGGDVWALGTTSARTLESCAKKVDGKYLVKQYKGSTKLYIYPSYKWKIVNHLITNFHAPSSSLVVLVSSFIGLDLTMKAYIEAIEKEYLFLSYGDSMLIL